MNQGSTHVDYRLMNHAQADLFLCDVVLWLLDMHDDTIRSDNYLLNPYISEGLHEITGQSGPDPEGRPMFDRLQMDFIAASVLNHGPDHWRVTNLLHADQQSGNSKQQIELKCTWSFWMICFDALQQARAMLKDHLLPKPHNGTRWGIVSSRHPKSAYELARDAERKSAKAKKKKAKKKKAKKKPKAKKPAKKAAKKSTKKTTNKTGHKTADKSDKPETKQKGKPAPKAKPAPKPKTATPHPHKGHGVAGELRYKDGEWFKPVA